MEEVKKLTIDSVTPVRSGTNVSGPWTLYDVQASGGKYRTFLDLTPGTTATFKIKVEQSEKLDRSGKPFLNRTITSYTGPVSAMPARVTADTRPNILTPADQLKKRVEELEGAMDQLTGRDGIIPNLLQRIENLESQAFDAINSKP